MSETSININSMPRRERFELYSRELFSVIESIREASNIKEINMTVGNADGVLKLVKKDYSESVEKALQLITKFWRRDASRKEVINCLEMIRQHVSQDLEKEKKNEANNMILRKLFLELAYHPEKVASILPEDFFDKLKK